jgi:hypothetical protein
MTMARVVIHFAAALSAGCTVPNPAYEKRAVSDMLDASWSPDGSPEALTGGLVLHWRFDEASGSAALDSSGNGLAGSYTGVNGAPTPSTMSPAVTFPDPHSRAFVMANDHGVRLASMPAVLKPSNNVTVAAWYRTSQVDSDSDGATGSEIVSAGNQYLIRVRTTLIEFAKRSGSTGFGQCFATVPNHRDGRWHHLAGISSSSGLTLYFDGVARCTSSDASDIIYDQSNELWVGRHGNGNRDWSFEGNIDEVRVYNRALSAAEISRLAWGGD